MIKKIAFTMYPVSDMARARAFYEKTLGLEMTENFDGTWVEYDLQGGCFAITNMVKEQKPSNEAGGSIAFEVDDVDQMTKDLREKGVRVALEPFSTPVCRISVILDPDGNGITLHQITD